MLYLPRLLDNEKYAKLIGKKLKNEQILLDELLCFDKDTLARIVEKETRLITKIIKAHVMLFKCEHCGKIVDDIKEDWYYDCTWARMFGLE